ncbi:MAG TPA: TrkH family potassium uptake protein [Candidatus Methylomirabilis sp.]|nr:TrkH family potassium uptake protein [Candidatus Methylomirabilis sp.]
MTPARAILLGFAGVILAGAGLLTLPGASASGESAGFLTALFTATSAVCVTGLVVVDTGNSWSTGGQLVIMGLIQTGGLSFMTMASLFFLLTGKRIGLRERILIRESFNQTDVAGMVRLVRAVLVYAFSVEAFFALVLAVHWGSEVGWRRGLWLGVFHAISAFNNAGFDLMGEFRSLTAYVDDPVVTLSISTLFILGGIGFSVVLNLWGWRERRLNTHSRLALVVTACLITAGTLLIFLFECSNTLARLSSSGRLLASYFTAVTPRTAGFNTLDTAALRPATQFLIVILMFIGASPGSTGGGIKTTTFGLLAASVWSQSRGREDTEVFRRRIPTEQVTKALAVTLLSGCLVTVVTLLLSLSETKDFLTVLFEVVSAFGTVGLSMGLTTHLTRPGRLLIIGTMFSGRVGPLTAMIALTQSARPKNHLRRVEDRVLIG